MGKTDKFVVHVISGTHWDREWRYTVPQSKLRLAALIDDLLKVLEEEPGYRCFHIDGGAVVLEDYLSLRPRNAEKVAAYVRAGRISLVNWYTLPEEFIVAPEALVRNLLVGRRMSGQWGGAMKTGYTATSYGQVSQLPQIYRGFGIETALFYRGTNKLQTPPVFRWKGPDGSELTVIRCFDEVTRTNWFFYVHQPVVLGKQPKDTTYRYDAGQMPVHMADAELYGTDFQVLKESDAFCEDATVLWRVWEGLKAQAGPQAIGGHVLALDMEDNAKAYRGLPRLLERMNAVLGGEAEFRQERLDEYVAEVLRAIDGGKKLSGVSGELRLTAIAPGWNGLLGMTQSSRMQIKLMNERAETALIGVAEPLASAAWGLGGEYPRAALDEAWRNLLQNHAHDSICGAAVDAAHRDMPVRFRATKAVADETSRLACEYLWQKLDLSAARGYRPGDIALTLFNTALFERRGVRELVVDLPVGTAADYTYFDVLDEGGEPVAHEVLSREAVTVRAERRLDTAVTFAAQRVRLLVPPEVSIPPVGYRTYTLRPRGPRYEKNPQPAGERGLIALALGTLENEHLLVRVNSNGTFDLTEKGSQRHFAGLHVFVDSGSIGNAHLDGVPVRDRQVTSVGCAATVSVVESNRLRGVLKIDLVMRVPAGATMDGKDRLGELVEMPISTWLSLRQGSRRLEVRTRVENRARDHRLRVLLPSGVATDTVSVESAFAVEQRHFLWRRTGDNAEGNYPCQPMQNFLDLSNGSGGLAVLNKGLREYEVMDDAERTIALTLFRGHRGYMIANKAITPEELEELEGAHSIGVLEYHYALLPHEGDWRAGEVMREAYDFKLPVRCLQGPVPPEVPEPPEASLPPSASLLSVDDPRVMLAAFCQSEDGKALTLRVWNTSGEDVSANLRTLLAVKRAAKVRMDETQEIEALAKVGEGFALRLRGAEIATLRLEL